MPDSKRYARLKSLLQEKIVSGSYAPGDRFFSQTEIMKKYGLSLSTVMRALDELVREGFLVRQQGKGTFVARVKAGTAPITATETRHVAMFTVWAGQPAGIQSARADISAIYPQLERLLPAWISLRLTPLSGKPDELEPYLFSRDPIDVALFFYPTAAHMAVLDKMAQFTPVIIIDSEPPTTTAPISSIITAPASATQEATTRLLHDGHSAIAIVINATDPSYAADCVHGYRDAIRQAGLPYRESLVSHTTPADPTGYHALLALIDHNADTQVTAVIATGSGVGLGVTYALRAMQHTSTTPISLVVCDDFTFHHEDTATAAQVHFPPAHIAQACASCINDALQTRACDPRYIKPTWTPPRNSPADA